MNRKTAKKRPTPRKGVLEAQRKKAIQRIEQLAEHAIESGPATPWTKADKEDILRRIREKYGNRNGSQS